MTTTHACLLPAVGEVCQLTFRLRLNQLIFEVTAKLENTLRRRSFAARSWRIVSEFRRCGSHMLKSIDDGHFMRRPSPFPSTPPAVQHRRFQRLPTVAVAKHTAPFRRRRCRSASPWRTRNGRLPASDLRRHFSQSQRPIFGIIPLCAPKIPARCRCCTLRVYPATAALPQTMQPTSRSWYSLSLAPFSLPTINRDSLDILTTHHSFVHCTQTWTLKLWLSFCRNLAPPNGPPDSDSCGHRSQSPSIVGSWPYAGLRAASERGIVQKMVPSPRVWCSRVVSRHATILLSCGGEIHTFD